MERNLNLDFDFDELTGNITPRNGSGISGVPEFNIRYVTGFNDIDFGFTIDNSGVTTKSVTLDFKWYAGLVGSYTAVQGGQVTASGSVSSSSGSTTVGGSGTWEVKWTTLENDGGLTYQEGRFFTLFLDSVEHED